MKRARRCRERGILRGCCLGVLVLLVLLGGAAFIVDRALAAPNLGPGPTGPSHGSSESQIAVALAAQLVAELVSNAHGTVTLSEQDLSVLAAENNPHPDRLHHLQAMVRDGDVLVSAQTSEGPLPFTAVAYLTVAFNPASTMVNVQVVRLDVGALTLPGWLRDRLLGSASPTLEVNQLFDSSALRPLRANIECIAVTGHGLTFGVHRPGVSPLPSVCAGATQ